MSKHTVELQALRVPKYVFTKYHDTSGKRILTQDQDAVQFKLSELTPDELSLLCDEFRSNIFAEAGKSDPKLQVSQSKQERDN